MLCQRCATLKIRHRILFNFQRRSNVISALIQNVETTLIHVEMLAGISISTYNSIFTFVENLIEANFVNDFYYSDKSYLRYICFTVCERIPMKCNFCLFQKNVKIFNGCRFSELQWFSSNKPETTCYHRWLQQAL